MGEEQNLMDIALKVPGYEQTEAGRCVFYEGETNGSPRIMFVGNSVTWHGPKADIGWENRWGMAASSREKDYVHLVETNVRKARPGATFCIVQGAEWEVEYDCIDYDGHYAAARAFAPDIVYFALGANTPMEGFESARFHAGMRSFLDYLAGDVGAKFVIGTNYWPGAINETIRAFAEENGYSLVELSDTLISEENRAVGRFWHEGVANHPGDRGMELIARRVWSVLEPLL